MKIFTEYKMEIPCNQFLLGVESKKLKNNVPAKTNYMMKRLNIILVEIVEE